MVTKCECLDCIKAESFRRFLHRRDMVADSLEETDDLQGTADEFIGGKLVALKPVTIYHAADFSRPYRTIKQGDTVGVIYSYINTPSGIWWHLEDDKFVKHEPGVFDETILQNSIAAKEAKEKAEIAERVQKRLDANPNPLYNLGESFLSFGNTLKWLIIGIVVLVGAALAYKLLK